MASDSDKARQRVLTREQCRAVDGYAIEQLGIPGALLMENAGRNTADAIEECLRGKVGPTGNGRVSIVCGRGNNGGDGFVIARHLALRGHRVAVDLLADPGQLSGDAALNHGIAARMGVPIHPLTDDSGIDAAIERWKESDVLVDAILGTGFAGTVREPLAGIIERINALAGPTVVAVDIPSGLDADTGRPGGVAVRADHTVTFVAAKVGLTSPDAIPFVGRLTVADIGAPTDLVIERLGIKPVS